MSKKTIAYLCLFFWTLNSIHAQKTEEGEIIITSESKRKVEKAVKLPEKPEYRDSVLTPQQVKYGTLNANATTSIVPETLKAANVIPKEVLDKLYRFYTKLGVGNYTNILGEFYFNQQRHATNDFGVYLKHFSSQGGINNVSFNGYSQNKLNVYGSKIWNAYKGNVDVFYSREALHYYGFNPDSFTVDKAKTKQIFNTLAFKLSGATHYANDTNKITHAESLTYRPYFDNRGAKDHNVVFDIAGGKKVNKEYYSLGLLVDFNQLNDDSCDCLTLFKEPLNYKCLQQQTNLILGLNPSITTLTGDLKIKIGLIANADIYDEGKFYFFPDVEFSYSLFNAMFIPYVGVNRATLRNSLFTLTQTNPFLVTNNEYLNTNQKLNVYGGIKGTWSANLSFNSKISYAQNERMPLFIEDTTFSFQNRFRLLYDNIDMLTADAHILFRTAGKWHILLGGTYYKYNVANETFAWNMPEFKVYSTLNYALKDKIIVRYNLELMGKRKTYSLLPVNGVTAQADGKYIYDLKPFVDTDIQLEYRYTKRLSVFANFNNLAGRYYRWNNYPLQSFNVLGGLTYIF